MNKIKINKEDVSSYILKLGLDKVVYIASNSINLDYYYNILEQQNSDYRVKYVNLASYSELELVGINLEILDFLNQEGKSILFLDINLALRVFFDKAKYMEFKLDEEYSREDIKQFLIEGGYTENYIIENKGEFGIRGDIMDIFPSNSENPIRLDFFDELLESIRYFSSFDQKSIKNIDSFRVYSNHLDGLQKEIIDLLEIFDKNNIEIIMENEELLDIKLEQLYLLDRDNNKVLKKRYERLKKVSNFLEVSKSSDRNYQEEIRNKKSYIAKRGLKYSSINQILPGDYVIHIEFGIGRYEGIENINDRDYLAIKYADSDRLYIPVEKLDRISKYVNNQGTEPKLYSLGTKGYRRKEKRLREDLEKFAMELVNIQAQRKLSKIEPYTKDTVWQEEFEEDFPFDLTLDQKKAVEEIKSDLESGILMDRLLIGDVGYGKTEVAMRTAFKAIENGYQCAILAPTTVLANQHYERCHKRFEKFGLRVENLSRLSGKNTKDVLEGLKNGSVDLVVGTHKLLGNDVLFKNLGLLIIDEEQKFGVTAKEKIKKIKSDIHLLTLSATPIPRTLNLALLGIRDISVIMTSPMDRLPIITERIKQEEIADVILKELARDGQVFYITNNVKGMFEKRKQLKEILPEFIKVEYIHGQLTPKEIKSIINDFDEGKFDVLIASTIIENGIDITNANSIIIEDYTSLGLSQIYQLRGRVGRGKRQGYCYLLEGEYKTKKGKMKDNSLDKIEGLEGGGYILSMEDLNIRGAGEILGEKQHGAIDMFGYDLYLKMLKNEVNRIKGEKVNELRSVELVMQNNGYIPKEYIEQNERILIYKRYAEVLNYQELKELNEEIKDRFGKIPVQMMLFITSIKIKLYMLELSADKFVELENSVKIYIKGKVIELSKEEFNKRLTTNLK